MSLNLNASKTTEDPAKEVLRVTVAPVKAKSFLERLTYSVGDNGFSLSRENPEVPVSIK
ncbi:MAG: hypothetical protein LC128_10200 [Chitinophagales bacterium]|nr:hypothetical protein [Chitinophagales bacterium]